MISQLAYSVLRHFPGYSSLRRQRDKLRGLREYAYDFARFSRSSSVLDSQISNTARLARVTKAYHMIEKGLALPEPRPGFGRGYPQAPISFLMREVPALEAAGLEGVETRGARAAMSAYVTWHDERGHAIDPSIRAFATGASKFPGGLIGITREELLAASIVDFPRFARSRHSIRNFTGEPVSIEAIQAAVTVALKSPRVCNRESRLVHVALEPEHRARMLAVQNGNGGFGHLAGAVLMVTSDLSHFVEYGERNQCWVDGGLFAMTLTYALHAQGLGTCMLNASNTAMKDRAVRKALNLADNEVIITFIAVGHLPEQLNVAASPSPSPDEVICVLR